MPHSDFPLGPGLTVPARIRLLTVLVSLGLLALGAVALSRRFKRPG